nr:hypothetical protein [Candidatus Sigynarchaeota archaeon]
MSIRDLFTRSIEIAFQSGKVYKEDLKSWSHNLRIAIPACKTGKTGHNDNEVITIKEVLCSSIPGMR